MSAAPAVTGQDLELEHAELLPARETLWVRRALPEISGPRPLLGACLLLSGSRPPLALNDA